MPNHCTNEVDIWGSVEDIETLHHLVGDELDFNKIVPMPECIKNTQSPTAIVSQEQYDKYDLLTPKEQEVVSLRNGRAITQEMSDTFMAKYGADNWYDWAVMHWGTKWEAYEFSRTDWRDISVSFCFYTAWSPPEPIYHKLVELFPNLNIDWRFADEDPMGFRGYWSTKEHEKLEEIVSRTKNMTIILNKKDVKNPLHPHLWDDFLETLGLDEDATEIYLERSLYDHNKIRLHPADKECK